MKRAAIYVRVSTQEQKKHGLSVDAQIVALRQFCADNGYSIVGTYNDAGISARKRYTRRPAMLQLLEDVKNGKVDIILFTKLDRWFRSVADYYEVQSVLDAHKVPWRAIWEDYETETSSGIFKVNIMLSVAQSEADRTSERLKSTFAYKKAQGHYIGSAPIGYRFYNKTELVKDESIKDAVQAMFDTFVRTLSTSKAIQEAKNHGFVIKKDTFLCMVKRTAYYGDASGYPCEPYISKADHDKIMGHFAHYTRKPKVDGRVYIFSGLCVCAKCGRTLDAKTIYRTLADGSKKEYRKYVCDRSDCRHLQITEPALEDLLIERISQYINDYNAQIRRFNASTDIVSAERKKASLCAKMERIKTMYEDGDIDTEAYRQKRDQIKAEISSIIIEPKQELPPLPNGWKDVYTELDDERKRQWWIGIIRRIEFDNDKYQPNIIFL